jgi:hypothetical protein
MERLKFIQTGKKEKEKTIPMTALGMDVNFPGQCIFPSSKARTQLATLVLLTP